MTWIRASARALAALFVASAVLVGTLAGAPSAAAAESDSQPKRSAQQQSKQPAQKQKKQSKQPAKQQAQQETKQPAQPKAAGPAAEAARPVPIPQGCADLAGVQREICIECDGVALHMRVVCHQKVFWRTCKGKRLFEYRYCQTHDNQAPRGEGG